MDHLSFIVSKDPDDAAKVANENSAQEMQSILWMKYQEVCIEWAFDLRYMWDK
jgi:hypothetical protein